MRKLLLLNSAQRFADLALLLLRVFVGIFLIWGVWDNVTSTERLQAGPFSLTVASGSKPKALSRCRHP